MIRQVWAVLALCGIEEFSAAAQSFTTLVNFDGMNGASPSTGLLQGTDGSLYGTAGGGSYSNGTIFTVTASGALTTLYSFCGQGGCPDGQWLYGELVQGADGRFYGTTMEGGAYNSGTVFTITSSGSLTTLYSFCAQAGCTDGRMPMAPLAQGGKGELYGTTIFGGANDQGTIFKISSSGTLTTLYSFCQQIGCSDGANPNGLVRGSDGNFYGTSAGGVLNHGTVFKFTPSGTLTILYRFCSRKMCEDGGNPIGTLIQAINGAFYGTTSYGGAAHLRKGTVFRITASGKFTRLYSFCVQSGCPDGESPGAGLSQANDGNFYGTTPSGGIYCDNGCGTLFRITPAGVLTTLYSFCAQSGCADGARPSAMLVQDTDGNLYGTTAQGGVNGQGTIFSLSAGLNPFVKLQPASGKVGASVNILGNELSGATSVTFNGIAADFRVISQSLIAVTVPAGATAGTVQVAAPSGTLSSNVPFRVLQ